MAKHTLNPLGLGYALGALSALWMLVLGILGSLGVYSGAVEMMQQWHLFFDLSVVGIILGMIEAGIISFLSGVVFAWLYNLFAK